MVKTILESKKNQLLTGYYYQIFMRNDRSKTALINGDGSNGTVNFEEIFEAFLETLKVPTVLAFSDRLLHIPDFDCSKYKDFDVIHFKASTGRFGFGSTLIDIVTHSTENVDSNKALIFPYHVAFYNIAEKDTNICMFHRFGHGGTKTAFVKEINRFLKLNYNFILKTKAIINEEYRNELLNGTPVKLRYITYGVTESSSDAAENIGGRVIKKYEEQMKISINLKSKKMKKRFKMDLEDFDNPSITFEEFPDSIFENAEKTNTKLDMLVNGRIKVWDADGRTMYDYEISDDLEYKSDNHPTDESIKHVMDNYSDKFRIGVDLDVD